MNPSKWRQRFSELGRERPGRRFERFHGRRYEWRLRHPVASRLLVILGLFLMVGGMVLSIPPLIPGFIVTLAGLALVVTGSRAFARLADRVELNWWKLVHRVRKRRRDRE